VIITFPHPCPKNSKHNQRIHYPEHSLGSFDYKVPIQGKNFRLLEEHSRFNYSNEKRISPVTAIRRSHDMVKKGLFKVTIFEKRGLDEVTNSKKEREAEV
jgi:hypothetical protein